MGYTHPGKWLGHDCVFAAAAAAAVAESQMQAILVRHIHTSHISDITHHEQDGHVLMGACKRGDAVNGPVSAE